MPLPLRYFTALSPSLVSGHFTTALGAICASSSPSFTIPSKSVATTSRLTSPGTIAQISSTRGRNGRFSLAMSDGFVVTPSTTPMATPSLISETFAVSRKIFIVRPFLMGAPTWPPIPRRSARPGKAVALLHTALMRSRPFDHDARARAHPREHPRVAGHPPHDVHGAGGTDLITPARGRPTEEDAEGLAWRPVAQIPHLDHRLRRLLARVETDREVHLVAPRLGLGLDGQRVPDGARRPRLVEPRRSHDLPGANPDRALGRHRILSFQRIRMWENLQAAQDYPGSRSATALPGCS